MRLKMKQIQHSPKDFIGKEVTLKGWVRSVRNQKNVAFIELYDGSTMNALQVVISQEFPEYEKWVSILTTGCSLAATGKIVENPVKKETVELHASELVLIGQCDATTYPLQKKRHSPEFLRTIAHLRPRTNTQGAVARLRHAAAYATHRFFHERGFLYLQAPIITAADCEGAGEMFRVSTLPFEKMPKTAEGAVDFKQDFFGTPTYLTVSGQLNGEIYASALSDIYTFGPTFRAENSNTSRHLAEFWMIEPEMAFADLKDNMECAESYLKYVMQKVLEEVPEEMRFFDTFIEPGLLERLETVLKKPFVHLTYTDAIAILKKAPKSFVFPVEWGIDLQSEHERYLAEEYCRSPLILTDYPKEIKAFYMRVNEDGKTVAAMDVLVPKIGEIIGGSQREERLDRLESKMDACGLSKEAYWWYLELRKYGSVPHAGFGVGFERLIGFLSGIENIRDVIAFPRFPGHADF